MLKILQGVVRKISDLTCSLRLLCSPISRKIPQNPKQLGDGNKITLFIAFGS